MAGGAFEDTEAAKRAHLYEYKITGYFIFSCIVAASGGALFGYDLGVSGEFFFLFIPFYCFNCGVWPSCLIWVFLGMCCVRNEICLDFCNLIR